MSIELRLGDCLDVHKEIPSKSVDLIIADFPYFKIKGDYWDNQWGSPHEFLSWMEKILDQHRRILSPRGSLYVFSSPEMVSKVEDLVSRKFEVLNQIVWNKNQESSRTMTFGRERLTRFLRQSERIVFAEQKEPSFLPIVEYFRAERLRANVITKQVDKFCGWRAKAHHFFAETKQAFFFPLEKDYEKLREAFSSLNGGGEYLSRSYDELKQEYQSLSRPFFLDENSPVTDVWDFRVPAIQKRDRHPCKKPVEMMKHIIETSTLDASVVLDSFMGTGNSGVAAKKLGRGFIGIEKDEKYFNKAEEKINVC